MIVISYRGRHFEAASSGHRATPEYFQWTKRWSWLHNMQVRLVDLKLWITLSNAHAQWDLFHWSNQNYFSELGFNLDHFVFTPYVTNKLIETTNPIWRKYREHKSLSFIFLLKKNYFRPFGGAQIDHLPVGQGGNNFYLPDEIFGCPGQSGNLVFRALL